MRESGRRTVTGRAPRIVDHGAARRRLREEHQRLRRRRQRALERFADRGPLRLDQLPVLASDEFDLLLELLDRLLAKPADDDGVRRARSRDGRLALMLSDPVDVEMAIVTTARGRLTLPAYTLTVGANVQAVA